MKKIILSFWPIFCIVLLWFVFSSPFFLKSQIPFPGDYQVTFFPPWSQYGQFAQPVKNNAMPDVVDQLYPWKKLVVSDWQKGQIPLWNPNNFAGTPLLANYQSAVFTPLNFMFFAFPFKIAWGLLVLFQPLLAGIGIYLFGRKITLSQIGATLASVAFMFCAFLVCWMGYGTLGYAIAVLPLILFGIESYLQTTQFRYVLLVAFGLAFSFFSGHFQISLYTLLATVAYGIFCCLSLKKKQESIVLFLAIVLGVFITSVQLFPTIAFYAQSLRSTLFARPEIIPWSYLFTLFAPDFFGNPVTRNDWFGHYAEWHGYIGVLPILFAFFSLKDFFKNAFVRFFSLFALMALLLATPTIFGDTILYLHIPVLATSAASRIIVLASFSLSILAGIGLDAWIAATQKQKLLLGIISLIVLLIGWGIIISKILGIEHTLIAKQNFLLQTGFLLAAILSVMLAFVVKSKKFLFLLSFMLFVLSCFDVYRFAWKWQSFSPASAVFPDVGITKFFAKIQGVRALGNYGGQVSLYYQIPSVEGYDALYPSRFGEFVSFVADGALHPASRSVVEFPRNGRYTREALNLLGVNYIIHKISDNNKPWAFPFWQDPKDFPLVYQDSAYIVVKNLSAFPRTFIAGNYIVEKNDTRLLQQLFSQATDRQKTVFLEQNPHIAVQKNLSASATITHATANTITIAATTSAQSLLFLSDTYFPGWYAYVDGRQTPILQADYTFRAIVLPKGTHTIVFTYLPTSFVGGVLVSAASVLGCLILYFCQKRKV